MGAYFAGFGGDCRAAWRAVRRHPSAFSLGLLSLALGIGLSTSSFALLDSLMPRYSGIPSPATLVVGERVSEAEYSAISGADAPEVDWVATKSGMCWVSGPSGSVRMQTGIILGTQAVSPGYFHALGIRPTIGRFFHVDDAAGDRSVVISHALWKSLFSADPSAIGQLVRYTRLDGDANEPAMTGVVIGVAPPHFDSRIAPDQTYATALWTLLPGASASLGAADRALSLIGRLGPNTTPQDARAFLSVSLSRLRNQSVSSVWLSTLERMLVRRWLVGMSIPLLLPLAALLICATNAGVLLWTMTVSQSRDCGVRVALGCGRLRLRGDL